MSLHYFPICRQDEDIRSIIFKYAKMGLDKLTKVNKTLFGVNSSNNPIMYRNLGRMLESIEGPATIPFNVFVNQYTFWPVFRVFMHKEKAEQAYTYLFKCETNTTSPF